MIYISGRARADETLPSWEDAGDLVVARPDFEGQTARYRHV